MLYVTPPTQSYNWLPSANPIVFTVKETEYLGTSQVYLVDVLINDVTKSTLKFPVVVNQDTQIDIHDIVNNSLSSTFVNDTAALVQPSSEWCKFGVQVSQQYYDTNNEQHTTSPSIASTNYAWYAAAPFEVEKNILSFAKRFEPYGTKPMFPTSSQQVFTEMPMRYTDRTTLVIKPNVVDKAYVVKGTTRITQTWLTNFNGTRPASYFIVYAFSKEKPHVLTKKFVLDISSLPATNAGKYVTMPVGATQLNGITWTYTNIKSQSLTSQILPSEDAYYVTVWASDYRQSLLADVAVSSYTLFAFDTCPKDEIRILYKSANGGWWEIRTHQKHYDGYSVKTSSMLNSFRKPVSADMRYLKAVGVDVEETMTLNTDWLNQFEVDEVADMLRSPDIYIMKNGAYLPAVLVDSEYQIADVKQDKLVSYTFNFRVEKPATLR